MTGIPDADDLLTRLEKDAPDWQGDDTTVSTWRYEREEAAEMLRAQKARIAELEGVLGETIIALVRQLGARRHPAWGVVRKARKVLNETPEPPAENAE